MKKDIKPLYRKVNSKVINCLHNTGPDSSRDRGTKDGLKRSMKQGVRRGLDYTPLYRFLHSKVGQSWDEIHSEITSRLPKYDESYLHIVKMNPQESIHSSQGWATFNEATYMSTMTVDENGLLQFINPNIKNEDFFPACRCCTHTFNGNVFVNKYNPIIGARYPGLRISVYN